MSSDRDKDAATGARAAGFRFSMRQLLFWMFCLCVVLALLVMLANAVRDARRAAIAMSSQSPLNQLQLALHNYHDTYGQLPPAYIADEGGTPIHSWRVLILPFIEEQRLYKAYDFSEPWHGPNNSKLADQMPRIFCSPSEKESNTFTNIMAVTGPGTAFPGSACTSLADFVDGLENTILLTEITNSSVPWLQPSDIDTSTSTFTINDASSLSISSVPWRRPYVVFADRIAAYAVRHDIPPDALKALTTIAGGERVTREDLLRDGHLD